MACPICDRVVVDKFKPFCSGRCADIDLSKWLSGFYAAPSIEPEDEDQIDYLLSEAQNKTH